MIFFPYEIFFLFFCFFFFHPPNPWNHLFICVHHCDPGQSTVHFSFETFSSSPLDFPTPLSTPLYQPTNQPPRVLGRGPCHHPVVVTPTMTPFGVMSLSNPHLPLPLRHANVASIFPGPISLAQQPCKTRTVHVSVLHFSC